jgi:hypothetical protein
MCTEGFTCLPKNTCKPLSREDHLRLRKSSSVENISIDDRRILLIIIDEGIIIEELVIDGRL